MKANLYLLPVCLYSYLEKMSSLENLISEARLLGNRLRENEAFADALIGQASNIQERLTAMKQVGMVLRNVLQWALLLQSMLFKPAYTT